MTQRKLFLYLAAAAGYIGLGLLFGYSFSDKANNTALWLGGLLVLFGVLLLGMFISRRDIKKSVHPVPANDATSPSHDDSTDL